MADWAAAAAFIERALLEEFEKVNPVAAAEADYKTMLQERLQAERKPAPRYTVIETAGHLINAYFWWS